MYILCKSMKFAHLPVAGGLYDQHPKLLADWQIIMSVEADVEKKRRDREERKAKATKSSGRRGR